MATGRLAPDFFQTADVVHAAKSLLGKYLVSHIGGALCSGKIVETEAYRGPDDKACHAWNNKKTPRTAPMFAGGGIAYVYLCYGIHHLFNVVTGPEGMPHAVLIRALEPADNSALMQERRQWNKSAQRLAAGPGLLTRALGITTTLSGQSLTDPSSSVWIEDRGARIDDAEIVASPRIGVAYAGECAAWEWRFCIKGHPCISKPA
jgi:DNA-3-methyladenine glycosylase